MPVVMSLAAFWRCGFKNGFDPFALPVHLAILKLFVSVVSIVNRHAFQTARIRVYNSWSHTGYDYV
jgi:hypothetical protein